jgi:hypothetical protein
MAIESIHLAKRSGSTTVREKNGNLMGGLWVLGKEIPENVGILQVGARISLLCMDEVRELDGITDEKDWGIVHDPITVTLLSVEFDSETSRVAGSIG